MLCAGSSIKYMWSLTSVANVWSDQELDIKWQIWTLVIVGTLKFCMKTDMKTFKGKHRLDRQFDRLAKHSRYIFVRA